MPPRGTKRSAVVAHVATPAAASSPLGRCFTKSVPTPSAPTPITVDDDAVAVAEATPNVVQSSEPAPPSTENVSQNAEFDKHMKSIDRKLGEMYDDERANENNVADASAKTLTKRQAKAKEQLTLSLDTKSLPPRSPLGQTFSREMADDAEMNLSYKALTNDADREAFRLKWAQRKLETMVVSKSHSTSWKEHDRSKSKPFTLARIAAEYGYAVDPESALSGAQEYAREAFKMGGSWAFRCPMSGLMMYSFLQKAHMVEFERAWATYEKYHSSGSVGPEPPAPTPPAAKAQPPTPKAKAAATPKAKSKPSSREPSEGKGDDTKAQMQECSKLRARYHSAVAKANGLVDACKKDARWKFANNEENMGQVASKIANLQRKLVEKRCEELVVLDLRELKQSMGGDSLAGMICNFLTLRDEVKDLEGTCAKMLNMYKAYNSIAK